MKVLVAVTGCVAAYKAVSLIRGLKKNEYEVDVMATSAALEFITEASLALATIAVNYKGEQDIYWEYNSKYPNHIYATEGIDAFIVAPATASTLGKMAQGIADNLVTSSYLAVPQTAKVIMCPAMNERMLKSYAVSSNMITLNARPGHEFISPVEGQLACGYKGNGKLSSTRDIISKINNILKKEK